MRLQFEGGWVSKTASTENNMHIYSFNIMNMFICTCNACVHCQPCTMWQDFEGGIYWDELVEIIMCNISRAAIF